MHLETDEAVEAGQLTPVRMLNEFTYCPRLFCLEWVQGEFARAPSPPPAMLAPARRRPARYASASGLSSSG